MYCIWNSILCNNNDWCKFQNQITPPYFIVQISHYWHHLNRWVLLFIFICVTLGGYNNFTTYSDFGRPDNWGHCKRGHPDCRWNQGFQPKNWNSHQILSHFRKQMSVSEATQEHDKEWVYREFPSSRFTEAQDREGYGRCKCLCRTYGEKLGKPSRSISLVFPQEWLCHQT